MAEGHQFSNASLMADLAGSRIITEDELDSITLEAEISEILGTDNYVSQSVNHVFRIHYSILNKTWFMHIEFQVIC